MADLLKSGNSEQQSTMLHKMKHDLEDWREAILLFNSVLRWEKKFYAGIIGGGLTFLFLMIWFMEWSVITMLSIAGLTAVVLDYLYPILAKLLFSADQWTGTEEKRYEEVCQQLCSIRMCACGMLHGLFVSREDKSIKYYLTTVISLILLAYFGSVINNLLLTYLVVMFAAMYPGLQSNGYVQIAQAKVCEFFGTHLKFLKQKVADATKKD